MGRISFLGPGYFGRSKNINSSRCINLFPELAPTSDGKSKVHLIGTPGTSTPFCTLPDTPHRGLYPFNGYMFAVGGNTLYKIDANGGYVAVGTLDTRYGRVKFKDNGLLSNGVGGNQLALVDGVTGYTYNVSTGSFDTISTSGGFPTTPKSLEFMDRYFIVIAGDMSFTVSDLDDGTTWNALALGEVSATSDPIAAVINYHQQLLFIKNLSTEVFYDNGTATSAGCPFSRIQGAVLDFGTYAGDTVTQANDAVQLLGWRRNDNAPQLVGVLQFSGGFPQVISPPNINYLISQFSTVNDAFAFTYTMEGHTFYQLTFPTENWTIVGDLTSPSASWWHERSTYSETRPVGNRHLADSYCKFNGKHYVADYRNGNIYEWRSDVYTDNGAPLISQRITDIFFEGKELEPFSISKLYIDMERGFGDVTQTSPPVSSLSWSNDGGYTFGQEYTASIGYTGQYDTIRSIWWALGYARNKVFKWSMSAPYRRVLVAAEME